MVVTRDSWYLLGVHDERLTDSCSKLSIDNEYQMIREGGNLQGNFYLFSDKNKDYPPTT